MRESLFGKKLARAVAAQEELYTLKVELIPSENTVRVLQIDGGIFEISYQRIKKGILDEINKE